MRILYVGDDWVGSNAASLADGFRKAGHEVVVVDSTAVSLPVRLSPPWVYSKIAHGRRLPSSVEALHRRIERVAREFRPDVVFAFKQRQEGCGAPVGPLDAARGARNRPAR